MRFKVPLLQNHSFSIEFESAKIKNRTFIRVVFEMTNLSISIALAYPRYVSRPLFSFFVYQLLSEQAIEEIRDGLYGAANANIYRTILSQ